MSNNPTSPLQGLTAFVTGAGSGLGAATARRLAADGARVGVNDLDPARCADLATEIGGHAYPFDVTDSRAFDQAIDDLAHTTGRLDILVNNAGIAPREVTSKLERTMRNQLARMEGRLDDMEPTNYLCDLGDDEWDEMIRIHLNGTFFGCRAALRHMQKARSGRIVNISSVLGLRPAAGAPHYSAAKAAIIALTRSVADEVAPLGINVNAVCPGYIDTPLLDHFGDVLRAAITMRIGKGHMGSAEDVASLVRFLCGPESSYCTGEVYPVTGGYQG